MPGSGKSTVGRQLARQLRLNFVDSDHEIEERIGMPVRSFFETQGEQAFRDLEQQVIDELTRGGAGVLATGGGTVLREANREVLRTRCRVIYLRATPEDLFRRLRHDTQRPLLQVSDPQRRLRELFRDRDPLYRAAAHYTVEAMRPSVSALVHMVMMQLEQDGFGTGPVVPPDASSGTPGSPDTSAGSAPAASP